MPRRKRAMPSASVAAPAPSPSAKSKEIPKATSHDEETLPQSSHPQEKGAATTNDRLNPHSLSGESLDPLLDEEIPADDLEDEAAVSKDTLPRGTKRAYEGGYNALKTFKGQYYSGMAVGGSHTWNYDPGTWHETKEEPDMWKIDFKATKRRARNAPKGSGAPVGTEYHWLIVGHQYVRKTDANTYETHLTGSKYKLAHKGANAGSWSVPTVKAQREREVELLEDSKRRVLGLPPVLGSEKVKVEKHEKGQKKLDELFARSPGGKDTEDRPSTKRKRET